MRLKKCRNFFLDPFEIWLISRVPIWVSIPKFDTASEISSRICMSNFTSIVSAVCPENLDTTKIFGDPIIQLALLKKVVRESRFLYCVWFSYWCKHYGHMVLGGAQPAGHSEQSNFCNFSKYMEMYNFGR